MPYHVQHKPSTPYVGNGVSSCLENCTKTLTLQMTFSLHVTLVSFFRILKLTSPCDMIAIQASIQIRI